MINIFISSPNETEREIIRLNMSKIETYKIEEVSNMINQNLITYLAIPNVGEIRSNERVEGIVLALSPRRMLIGRRPVL